MTHSGGEAARAKIALGLALLAGAIADGVGTPAFQARAAAASAQAEEASKATTQSAERPKPVGEKLPRTDLHGDPLPEGAQARLGTIRFRHDHSSLHLRPAFSPDGKMLATGHDGIRLWESATGKLLREVRDGFGYHVLFFAPDGRWLAGERWLGNLSKQDGHTVRLWDPQTGQRLLDIPTDGRVQVCSPDGKQIVTTTGDGSVFLWDTTTGKQTTQLRGGHKRQTADVAFTANGKGLVTIGDRSACHWDLASGRLEKTVELNLPRRVHSTCLSPDGQSLAVSPREQGPVFVLDTATGKERFQLQGELAQGGYGLAFSPDGKTLATNQVDLQNWKAETDVAFWDASTGKLRHHFAIPFRGAWHLCFAPDGRTLVTAGQEPLIHLWDVATRKPVHNWSAHEGWISALAFIPDSSALVSGSLDGSVRLWEVKSGKHLRELQGHRWGITGVAVTPEGKTIVSSGNDGCVRLQRPDGTDGRRLLLGRPPEELDSPEKSVVYSLGISPDGKTAATYSWIPKAGIFYHVWDLSTGKAVMERRDPAKVISGRTFSPDGRLVLQYVRSGGAEAFSSPPPGGGGGVGQPGSTLAVLEDVATGKRVLTMPLPAQAGNIGAFAADSRSLLTASSQDERKEDGWHSDNTLHLWELASRKVRLTITWSGRARFIQAVLAPNGRTVATARDDQTTQIWDLTTGKELLRRDGFSSRAGCLAFAPDGRSLASGHRDGTILVWDVAAVAGHQEKAEARPDQRRIDEWWSDLAGDDAGKAHLAMWRLAAAPGQTVDWLRDRLEPAKEVPADQLRSVIADLDSTKFSQRQAASKQLASLADRAGPALRAALKADLSAEQRRRIEEARATLMDVPPANALRDLRAVEVLERIGSPEAKPLLEMLAKGAPEARLTREAEAALQRLARR
jgi:WD40 repeat protein